MSNGKEKVNNVYQCGGRTCTDTELDQLERLKSGEEMAIALGESGLAAPGETVAPGYISDLTKKVDDLCVQFPELCRKVDSVAGELHGHPEPDDSLIAHLESCPTCSSRLVSDFIPKLAAKYGYSKNPAAETVAGAVDAEAAKAAAEKEAAEAAAEKEAADAAKATAEAANSTVETADAAKAAAEKEAETAAAEKEVETAAKRSAKLPCFRHDDE